MIYEFESKVYMSLKVNSECYAIDVWDMFVND